MLRTCVAGSFLEVGDERAVALLERAETESRSRGEVWWLPETLRLRALADRAFGRGASARALLDEARRLAEEQGSVLLQGRIDAELGPIDTELGPIDTVDGRAVEPDR